MRRLVLDRDGWRCQQCARAGRLEVDHRIPLEDGGDAYNLDNLQNPLPTVLHRENSHREPGHAEWFRPKTKPGRDLVTELQ